MAARDNLAAASEPATRDIRGVGSRLLQHTKIYIINGNNVNIRMIAITHSRLAPGANALEQVAEKDMVIADPVG